MATVSPINNNQVPLFKSDAAYTTPYEGDAATPFGEWLDEKSFIEDRPAPLAYDAADAQPADDSAFAPGGLNDTAIDDAAASTEEPPIHLFKTPEAPRTGENESAAKAADGDNTARQNKAVTEPGKQAAQAATPSKAGAQQKTQAPQTARPPQETAVKVTQPATARNAAAAAPAEKTPGTDQAAPIHELKTNVKPQAQAALPATAREAAAAAPAEKTQRSVHAAQIQPLKTNVKPQAQAALPATARKAAEAAKAEVPAKGAKPTEQAAMQELKANARTIVNLALPATARKAAAAVPARAPQPTDTAASMQQLRANVKAIFNGLTPLQSAEKQDTAAVRQNQDPKGSVRLASIDNVKPIRLTTLPVDQPQVENTPKTTIHHLNARKSMKLDASMTDATIVRDFKDYPKADAPAAEPGKNAAKDSPSSANTAANTAARRTPSLRNNILFETELTSGKQTSRLKGKGRRNEKTSLYKGALPAQAQGFQIRTTGMQQQTALDAARSSNAMQAGANATLKLESVETEGASSESKQNNNLFARSNANTQAAEAKQTSKSAPAHASRSLSWLKSLANRTSFMNRNEPNWKVLEMRLDKGDGNMLIKVMREDDAVTVSVQFSDDHLRAQAELQTAQIIESLREQYGQDVMFSFADRDKSQFDSQADNKTARQNRLKKLAEETEKTVPARHFNPHAPDQHLWIG